MIAAVILAAAIASGSVDEEFLSAANSEITEFATRELFGHYNIEGVEIVEVRESEKELGGGFGRYGFKAVRATVVGVRNQEWSENLNPTLRQSVECETSAMLFLLCRPEGYRVNVALELELVATTDGWKIVERNLRSLRRHPFDKNLACAEDRSDTSDEEIIRNCLASSPSDSLHRTRPLRRGSLRSVANVGRAAQLRIR